MKTINFKTMIIAAIASLLFFSACKKDNPAPQPPAKTIAGEWEGLYGYGVNAPNAFWNFQINKDGTMLVKSDPNQPYKGTGTWTLNGKVFKGKFTYEGNNTFLYVNGTVDIPTGIMTGNYSVVTEDAVGGDFNMKRK